MKRLRVLTVTFNIPIEGEEIGAFRGALINKVGLEHEWFHNHNNDTNSTHQYHYRYPLIQYKRVRNKPMLVFLDDCIEEAHKLFSQSDWTLDLKGKPYAMKVKDLGINEFNIQVWENTFKYNIRNWLPITQKNMKEFNSITRLSERINYLERKLANHLVSFAKGIGYRWEKRIEVHIQNIQYESIVQMKGNKLKAFTLDFETNLFVPNYVGLGKSVSRGFGVVTVIKDKKTASVEV
ncbi:MAG: CRISPR-associated endonuclease Cas6 [Saprospiraceae bacterium]